VVVCLPLDLRFAGSHPVEDDGFLRAIKIRGRTSFGGGEKLSAQRRKILRNVKELCEHERNTS
jgi:hypothetical protein